MVLGLILSSNAYAEIIFKNCDLSPNLGKTDIKVFLEKNQMNLLMMLMVLNLLNYLIKKKQNFHLKMDQLKLLIFKE